MNQNNTSIMYSGTVDISTNHKRILSHNNGSLDFFRLLNKFVSRQAIGVGELPGYLMMYKCKSEVVLSSTQTTNPTYASLELFTSNIPVISNIVASNASESVLFSATLTASSIKPATIVGEESNVCLALVSADTKTILAATDIEGGDSLIRSLQSGLTASVKWRMSFENVEDSPTR